ncbi:DUF167 domain-containing protein [Candidatus Micrarchaeota archaeon]|nr:DUF167 domain-containing protein [Candidatus Micrarchaeota archaeon]
MIIELAVVPNSKRFSVSLKPDLATSEKTPVAKAASEHSRRRGSGGEIRFKDGRLKVCLKSAPEHNKANLELVKEISKLLGCDVRLVSGQTSHRKRLEISASEKEWADFLETLQKSGNPRVVS